MSSSIELQSCEQCHALQYPTREICRRCLSADLQRKRVDGGGKLLSWSAIHHSFEPKYQQQLPWHIAQVKLQSGPCIIAQLQFDDPKVGMPVDLVQKNTAESEGQEYFVAVKRNWENKE